MRNESPPSVARTQWRIPLDDLVRVAHYGVVVRDRSTRDHER